MAIVAITAPAHARSLFHLFFDLSFTYEQQRQSAFERTPILGSVDTHATHNTTFSIAVSRCRLLQRGIIDAIGIDTDEAATLLAPEGQRKIGWSSGGV